MSQTEFGHLKAAPLKPGGENMSVTNDNREGETASFRTIFIHVHILFQHHLFLLFVCAHDAAVEYDVSHYVLSAENVRLKCRVVCI